MAKPMTNLHPKRLALALITTGLASSAQASEPPVWRPVPAAHPPPAASSSQPIEQQAVEWQPVERSANPRQPAPIWELVPLSEGLLSAENPDELSPAFEPPANLEEAEALLNSLWPIAADYFPLLRLGQLPTSTLPPEGGDQISFQQVSPGDGGVEGGSGNQNYGIRADLVINRYLLLSGFYTNADDPFYKRITVRPSQPANLWEIWGASLRARLASFGSWSLAGQGSLELFTVGSGCGGAVSCNGPGTPNIFNNSGEKVFTRNWVGSLALPLSWQATPQLQLSFVPGVTFLPDRQGAGQGGSGTFYGTSVNLGFGANYQLGNQLQLFGSAMVPLGPGTNAFDGELNFSRVPILSAGAHVAVNPRIGLEASVTNGFGLTPATAILALPSAPREPMVSARFVWTPVAVDSPNPDYTLRQASLALGGLSVNTALTPSAGTTQLWVNSDTRGNLFGGGGYSVSNDFQFQLGLGVFNGIEPRNNFVNSFAGDGGLNLRYAGKVMLYRPTKTLPIWAAARVSVGRNEDASSKQGYMFIETMNTWEATPQLAFSLNPKLAWSGAGTSWGVGLAANLQLTERLQLIPELNAVATDLGGRNGTNGSLALRWLASNVTTLDLYVSNAAGLYDLGQLLGNDQVRVGARVLISF